MSANFIELDSIDKAKKLLAETDGKKRFIFKHSNACPISSDAYQQVSAIDTDIYLVVVQTARDVSNFLEKELGVLHESPQAIIIVDGKVVFHDSHRRLTTEAVSAHL